MYYGDFGSYRYYESNSVFEVEGVMTDVSFDYSLNFPTRGENFLVLVDMDDAILEIDGLTGTASDTFQFTFSDAEPTSHKLTFLVI